MKLYVWRTRDEYELPLFVTDSLKELSKVSGRSESTILSLISKNKRGELKRCAFDRIIVKEDMDC